MPKRPIADSFCEPTAHRRPMQCIKNTTEKVPSRKSARAHLRAGMGVSVADRNGEIDALIRKNACRGDCVVELGCGVGGNLMQIAAAVGEAGQVVAVDSSPDSIYRLRNQTWLRHKKNVSVYLSRGDSLPLEPSTVDVIFCQGLVSPSGPRSAVYREMLRVLRPGGTILVHDIIVHQLLPPEIADSVAAFSSGLAGAIEAVSYRHMLEKLDLRDVTLTHCPSHGLLSALLIPSAHSGAAGRDDSTLADLRGVLPDFISVVRIRAQKLGVH